jgi:ribosomal protein S18 acetylase RimI-like enzyme
MSRDYPDEPADGFPRPPATETDREDREIDVHVADEADREALVAMYEDFDPEDRAQGIPPVREDQIRDWLDALLADGCLNVVAAHGDDLVGHATLVPDSAEGYELAIFVLRAYQGAGVGTHLINYLLGHARAEGAEKMWLTVERWNDPAIALYEKVGFELCNSESFELEMTIRL